MGYSCTAIAGMVLDELISILQENLPNVLELPVNIPSNTWVSNTWVDRHKKFEFFYEFGKEHEDGRITGTIHRGKIYNNSYFRYGSVLISSKGKVIRFPGTTKEIRIRAEAQAMGKFIKTFGNNQAAHDFDLTLGR